MDSKRNGEALVQIFVDADACPVVGIVEEIAEKYNISTTLLCDTNHMLYSDYSEVIVVGAGADAVDYKLISICHKGDVVVSQDYGVAAMALGKGAYAIHQSGKWYTNENIDQMLMERHLNKKARRSSHKIHMKGCTMSGGHRFCTDRSGNGDTRKRTEEDDVRFAQSFEKLILMAEINQYRQELKDRIISYAMPEFYKRGVKAVKMDEISQGLHVSKRTVYEIFGDKEELLLAGMMRQLEENRSKLENFAKTQAKNVIDIISYVYKLQMERNGMVGVLFYEEVHKMPRVVKFFQENHAHEREESVRFFEAGVKEGLFRKDVDFNVVMDIGHVMMEEIMHHQLYRVHSMQEIYDNYILCLIRGFCTERGLEQLDRALKE